MEPLRLGIIGTGSIAQAHLRGVTDLEEVEVVAVADVIEEKAKETAQQWGIASAYQDYHELLGRGDVEAVTVCTPNQAHRAPTIDALQAGKHVLVEKPMAATLEDAAAMTKAAHETDKLLMVALKTRYEPYMQAAQAIMDSGALGDVYYSETVAARRCGIPRRASFLHKATGGIGATADIGVYSLDAALNLMGHPRPVAVSGIANNLLGTMYRDPVMGGWGCLPDELEVEDFGVAWVRFESGAAMVFKTCWIMHMDSIGGTFFLGTRGGLRLEPLTVYRHAWGQMTDVTPQSIPKVDGIELFKRENRAFAVAIREGKPSPIPADEMLLTNVIIQGLIDSAAAGHEIPVSVPDV